MAPSYSVGTVSVTAVGAKAEQLRAAAADRLESTDSSRGQVTTPPRTSYCSTHSSRPCSSCSESSAGSAEPVCWQWPATTPGSAMVAPAGSCSPSARLMPSATTRRRIGRHASRRGWSDGGAWNGFPPHPRSAEAWSGTAGAGGALKDAIEAACFTDAPVVLTGETRAGRGWVARLIHSLDARPRKGELVPSSIAPAGSFPRCRAASSSATSAGRSPARRARGTAPLLSRIAARCSSTRSVSSRWRSRASFCALCRRAPTNAWAGTTGEPPHSAWSARPTAICSPKRRRAGSATTCSTAWPARLYTCRASVSAATTSSRSLVISSVASAPAPRPSSITTWRRSS